MPSINNTHTHKKEEGGRRETQIERERDAIIQLNLLNEASHPHRSCRSFLIVVQRRRLKTRARKSARGALPSPCRHRTSEGALQSAAFCSASPLHRFGAFAACPPLPADLPSQGSFAKPPRGAPRHKGRKRVARRSRQPPPFPDRMIPLRKGVPRFSPGCLTPARLQRPSGGL